MVSGIDKQEHNIKLDSRKHMDICGVVDVESFDEEGASLVTVCGALTVEGRGIKISSLDLECGVVRIDGNIDALFYKTESDTQKRSFIGKLLK